MNAQNLQFNKLNRVFHAQDKREIEKTDHFSRCSSQDLHVCEHRFSWR